MARSKHETAIRGELEIIEKELDDARAEARAVGTTIQSLDDQRALLVRILETAEQADGRASGEPHNNPAGTGTVAA